MKLIDLYVAEVGRRLPARQRLDIETELRSALEDAVDDEAAKQGRPADEALAADVLRRYGPPEKTAASYRPARYLIGPELFPAYLKALSGFTSLLVLLSAIALGAQLGVTAEARADVAATLGQAATGLGVNFLHLVFIVTAAFAVYEWSARRLAPPAPAWDPATLKEQPERAARRDGPLEITLRMVFTVAALIVFNFSPQWVGINWLQAGQWRHVPVLGPAFFVYLPWLSLWWLLQLALDGLVLAQRRRTPLNEWLEVGVTLFRLVLAFIILLGPAIMQLDPAAVARLGMDAQSVSAANDGLNTLVRVALGISCAVGALNWGRTVYRRLTHSGASLTANGAAHGPL
jgi:hypothetical protein